MPLIHAAGCRFATFTLAGANQVAVKTRPAFGLMKLTDADARFASANVAIGLCNPEALACMA